MLSKRKRVARCHEDTPEELLAAYHARRPVDRQGKHGMLRWLVIARTYPGQQPSPCPMDAANAHPTLLSTAACREMESRVAARVMGEQEFPSGYLEYACAFFQWWYRVAAVLSTPRIDVVCTGRCAWLEPVDIEKSLVVPDVRRGAVKIAQELAVRAGEFEVVSAMGGGRTRSVSATLQALRTGEWCGSMQKALMYGTIDDIYHAGLLAAVHIAIVDSRYQGRLSFAWIKEVLRWPSRCPSKPPWPIIYVHGGHFVVVWHGAHLPCTSFSAAYETWRDMCLARGGIIGGRYDVRKCTI